MFPCIVVRKAIEFYLNHTFFSWLSSRISFSLIVFYKCQKVLSSFILWATKTFRMSSACPVSHGYMYNDFSNNFRLRSKDIKARMIIHELWKNSITLINFIVGLLNSNFISLPIWVTARASVYTCRRVYSPVSNVPGLGNHWSLCQRCHSSHAVL